MFLLRGPEHAFRVADPGIRRLVELRFSQVCDGEPYDPDRHGFMVVVEPGDGVESLERESGCPILHDTFFEVRFGHPDFTPAAEVIEKHTACYELLYVGNDDGFGITVIVPKADGIDPELLAMCEAHAVPAAETSEP